MNCLRTHLFKAHAALQRTTGFEVNTISSIDISARKNLTGSHFLHRPAEAFQRVERRVIPIAPEVKRSIEKFQIPFPGVLAARSRNFLPKNQHPMGIIKC